MRTENVLNMREWINKKHQSLYSKKIKRNKRKRN